MGKTSYRQDGEDFIPTGWGRLHTDRMGKTSGEDFIPTGWGRLHIDRMGKISYRQDGGDLHR